MYNNFHAISDGGVGCLYLYEIMAKYFLGSECCQVVLCCFLKQQSGGGGRSASFVVKSQGVMDNVAEVQHCPQVVQREMRWEQSFFEGG